jgi:hypothetical protein
MAAFSLIPLMCTQTPRPGLRKDGELQEQKCTSLVGSMSAFAPSTVEGTYVRTAATNIAAHNAKGWVPPKTSTEYYEQVVWYHCSNRPRRWFSRRLTVHQRTAKTQKPRFFLVLWVVGGVQETPSGDKKRGWGGYEMRWRPR